MSTSETAMGTGRLADRGRTAAAEPGLGTGRALSEGAGFVLRQLAGCVVAIAFVWAVVMLFHHVPVVGFVLLGIVLVLGGGALFIRNRSLS